jgi:hypothetical protein
LYDLIHLARNIRYPPELPLKRNGRVPLVPLLWGAAMNSHPQTPVVLLVEDEWMLRATITPEFLNAGWHVLETATGEGALALLRSGQRIDVLITDIHLAGYI